MQDQKPKIDGRKTRKHLQRSKNPGSGTAQSEGLKKWWANPENRAKICKPRPPGYTQRYRDGIPDGMTAAEADPLWAKARVQAEIDMKKLEDEGHVSFDMNLTDDQLAREAMLKLLEILRSPSGNKQMVNSAAGKILEYTKAKPASKTDLRVNSAEAWLQEVLADHKASDGDSKPH